MLTGLLKGLFSSAAQSEADVDKSFDAAIDRSNHALEGTTRVRSYLDAGIPFTPTESETKAMREYIQAADELELHGYLHRNNGHPDRRDSFRKALGG